MAKQEKVQMHVFKFRTDYTKMRNQFEKLKAGAVRAVSRLLEDANICHAPLTLNDVSRQQIHRDQPKITRSRFPTPQKGSGGEHQALDEHTFIQKHGHPAG
ncbi:uncharacterized protein LACBIDRAFT_296273 [Laccaria bicolor S238N-H82]|uniref:Predicted protein n=1 Tax=Laccaria bicolor (strain S238N-H82 / ATCC MYA-4686) TaxID=486041 RepID=B0D8D8_LACBS|nr:uncharacterized protein LACBIDRAFT_296273 [Laccaria bicolor S238N-H82]EDR09059.1 predicted protein [Laccaria bicolor S238N-H82]|eukprot:XP_001880372.1 predicted protein [Laccaria bicolor S238N-H82]